MSIDEIIGDEFDDLLGDGGAIGYEEDEIIGDEWEDALGATRRRRGGGNKLARLSRKMAELREIDPDAVLVKRETQSRRRFLDLGLPVTTIGAGATEVIEIKPQRTFRAQDFLIPDSIAAGLRLRAVSVGQNSQFAGGSPVPLETYSTLCYRPRMILWDTAQPGVLIQLSIQNTTAGDVEVTGTLRGTATVR